jgi:two-component system chemotaxis sensor kinase CheA
VKRYLEQINGAIELESTSGKGCNFTIKLPLTLAIIPALMVRVRTEIFAIPLISVEEAIRITSQDVRTIESHKVVHLREKMIPLIDLADLLGASVFKSQRVYDGTLSREITANASDYEPDKLYGVIISDGLREIGLIVDALLGENDIVIKSLNDELVNVEGISGASIRGDGQVSLVIDAVSLIELAIKHLRSHHRARSQKKFAFDTGHDDALSRSENFKGYSQTSVSEESETI